MQHRLKVANPAYLIQRRLRLCLTQPELAARAGVSGQSVQNWETGRVRPQHSKIPRLAEALGVPLEDLLTAIDGPPIAASPTPAPAA